MKTNTNVRYSCNEDINNSRINTLLHTNTHKPPHDEHLKAGSVSAIVQATGEFIKKLPLATEA